MRPIDADAVFPWYVDAFKGRIEPGEVRFSMKDIAMNLNNIPTLKQRPHWIPIDKRLPDEASDVLCFTNQKEMVIACCYKYDDGDYDFDSYDCDYEGDIIAWMPLPEPYKGGNTE